MKFFTNFVRRGDKVHVKYIEDGERKKETFEVSPVLYMKSPKQCGHTSVYGDNLAPVSFKNTRDARSFSKDFGENVFGFDRYEYEIIDDNFGNEYDEKLVRIVYLDIETEIGDEFCPPHIATQPINAISLIYNGHVIQFGWYDYVHKEEGVKFVHCHSEKDMMNKLVETLKRISPDILSGWNSNGFDIPYILTRLKLIFDDSYPKKLSPFNSYKVEHRVVDGRDEYECEIAGIALIDSLEAYKKFRGKTRASYKLDYIVGIELGEQKTPYAGTLKQLYENDKPLFFKYNNHDTRLVYLLEQKLGIIAQIIQVAYITKINYEDVFMSIRIWDCMINNHLRKQNIHVPFSNHNSGGDGYEGAFVKDTIAGWYPWCVSFDYRSLYPSVMQFGNISPETMAPERFDITVSDCVNQTQKFKEASEFAKSHDYTLCANGVMYRKDIEGFIPLLARQVGERRDAAKNKMKELKKELQSVKAELEKLG